LIDRVADAIAAFNELPRPVRQTAVVLGVLAPAVTGAVAGLAGLVSAASAVTGALAGLVPVLGSLTGPLGLVAAGAVGIATNFAGLRTQAERVAGVLATQVTKSLQALGIEFASLDRALALVDQAFAALERTLRPFVSLAGDVLVAAIRGAGQTFRQDLVPAVEAAGRRFQQFRQRIVQVVGPVATQIQTRLGQVVAFFDRDWRTAWEQAQAQARTSLQGIRQTVTQVMPQVEQAVRSGLTRVRGVFQRVTATIEGVWSRHGDEVQRVIRETMAFVKANPREALLTLANVIVPGPLQTIVRAFRENWNKIERNTRTSVSEIQRTVRVGMTAVERQIIDHLTNSQSRTRTTLSQIQSEFNQAFATINQVVSRLLGTLLDVQNRHTQRVGQLWRTHLSGPNGILANARTAFNALWNNIVKPILDTIQAGWQVFGDDLVRLARGFWGTALAVSRRFLDLLLTAVNVTLDLISGDWEGAWTNIEAFFKRTWDAIVSWARTSGRDLIVGAFNIITKAIRGVFNTLGEWLIGNSFFPEMIGDIVSYLTGAGKSAISGAFGTIVGAIENTLNGIDLSGISNAINGIIDAAEDAISAIADIPDQKTTTITRVTNYETDVSPPTNYDPGSDDDDDDDGGGGGDFGGRGPGGADDDSNPGNDDGSGGFVGLHTGGIVNAGRMPAMLHGPEAVVPLDRLEPLMAGALDAVAPPPTGSGGGDVNITVRNNEFHGLEDADDVAEALYSEVNAHLG
jgi:hypothetical protein